MKTQLKNETIIIKKDQEQDLTFVEPGKYTVVLAGAGAQVNIGATFKTKQKEIVDLEVIIHHRAPHTRAETTLKGVAEDESRIRFVGRIIIDENCGDTNSFLTEKILLLSDKATAEAVPDLEISSDDVKCSHAATISNLPPEQIFYLQSRGLNKKQAQDLIVDGFLS